MLMPYYIGLALTIFLQEWSNIPWLMHVYLSVIFADIMIHIASYLMKDDSNETDTPDGE